mmetsp:Transcript_19602/g.63555  ORF Transcript_19602/g.63555 Transcript_19602/m.63555 type:complete len:144 (+) Transcript_19602:46-477(+)
MSALTLDTEGQKYISEHGMAPREVPELDEEFKDSLRGPKIDCVQNWNGKGRLATYGELEQKMTQKYRLLGEECVVIGCKCKIDTPKYVMELIGGPVCMECAQKLCMQQFKGLGPNPYEPEFEKPTAEDIEKAKAAGISMPGWE